MRSTIPAPEPAIIAAEGFAPSASGRNFRVPRPRRLAAAAAVALAFGLLPAAEAKERAVRSCGVVAGASWTVGSQAGRTWAIFTDLADCDAALRLVPGLTGKGIVDIAEAERFRCTAQDVHNGRVLSGICYEAGQADSYFAWGATAPGYDHPTACGRCTGIPNEHVAAPVTANVIGRP